MTKSRLAVWSPLPPSPSGIADYVAESLPALARHFDVETVSEEPHTTAPTADLHLYHLGNSPAHAFVYRAARARPGVVVLHDWSLHHLVLSETVERGDVPAYLREMRRAYGETGTFVGRQVARALGGDLLPARFPLNERVLEASLAVVTLSAQTRARAAGKVPGRPVLHLAHHLHLPLDPLPDRAAARVALGLRPTDRIVCAPGLATAAKRLEVAARVVARLRADDPRVRLVVAGGVDPRFDLDRVAREAGIGDGLVVTGRLGIGDFVRHLCSADVVLALRFPSHGEMSGALVRALGVGRPVLVSAGTAAADEFPEGVIVRVDPGPREEAEIEALLRRLLDDEPLREAVARLARAHVVAHHDLERTVLSLVAFLEGVAATRTAVLAERAAEGTAEGGLLGFLLEEVRWGARDLGLADLRLGLEGLLQPLVPERP
jgi:glycosyltransferase involved in cell wall biosynthesis